MYIRVFVVFILTYAVTTAAEPGRAPLVQLNDGHEMPTIALGTWLGNSSTGRIVPEGREVEYAALVAFDAGYRHVDTAWAYRVEGQVGRAVKMVVDAYNGLQQVTTTPKVCGVNCYLNGLKQEMKRSGDMVPAVPREEIFITTKLWNDAHARSAVVPALRASLRKLRMSYVDLYLMHWPLGQFANQSYDYTHYLETWRGMMDAQQLNLTRSIGVCNFNQTMLEDLRVHQLATPAVLQIEWNLNLQQPALLEYCRQHNIAVMGYTPFGSLMQKHRPDSPTDVEDPTLRGLAEKYNKTVPQILLRYAVAMGVTPIPKSLTPSRIAENFNIFDFQLDGEDKTTLQTFDKGYRTVPQLKWKDHPFYPFEIIPEITEQVTSVVDLVPLKMNFRDIKV